jgi:peptide/nickel transport system ATP-binding protein
MLETRNLSYRYGESNPWLFRDLSFSLSPGEIVGLPGPSGTGKTTLARVLAGFLPVLEGDVLIDKRPIRKNGFHPVQMIFQHPELAVNPHWKVAKILNEGFQVSDHLMASFGIEDDWFDRHPWELSGGQLARICLVRALGPETKFLVADEMTAMLDAVTQAKIWESLLKYSSRKEIGLLVISHDVNLINQICSRTIDYFKMNSDQVNA